MSTISKKVRIDGSGDYNDLATAVTNIFIDFPDIDQYILDVDDEIYTGSFIIDQPLKSLIIKGNSSCFILNDSCSINVKEFQFNDFELDPSGISVENVITNSAGVYSKFENVIITKSNSANIINNLGLLELVNFSAIGNGLNTLINNSGSLEIINLCAHKFNKVITSSGSFDVYCTNLNISDSNIGIEVNGNSVYIDKSLIYGCETALSLTDSNSFVRTSTISDNVNTFVGTGSTVEIDRAILYSVNQVFPNTYTSIIANDSNIYPVPNVVINETKLTSIIPQFRDKSKGDYRLIFDHSDNSPIINKLAMVSDFDIVTEQDQFIVSPIIDENSHSSQFIRNYFDRFIYKNGDVVIFSDYGKELQLASAASVYSGLKYKQFATARFEMNDIPVICDFDKYKWDWDMVKLKDFNIRENETYVVPRTIIDLNELIETEYNTSGITLLWNAIKPTNIRPQMRYQYRGISIDNDLSTYSTKIQWVIEGMTQSLLKMNVYSGEVYDRYPLLCIQGSPAYVKPEGIEYLGVVGNTFKYADLNDTSKDYNSDSATGEFKLLYTNMDINNDVYGIYAHKGNLFITCTRLPSVTDRNESYKLGGAGYILMYSNNSDPLHYMASMNTTDGPKSFALSSDITRPTDLTISEDGKLLIMDYFKNSIKSMRFAYDYALIQSTYDSETRALLREEYDDVQL